MFLLITPATYAILVLLWSFILYFYIKKMWSSKTQQLFSTLVLILAIDAFRTLFESVYFGLWYTSLSGILSPQIGVFLTRPEIVIIPKILNVIAAVVVIVLLLRKWLPKEEKEQERATEVLRESENRYFSLFAHNHSVMLLLDPDNGNIVDANLAACDYYGYSLDQLTGMQVSEINIFSKEKILQKMAKVKSEQKQNFLFQHKLANGEIRAVEVYSGPIVLEGKQLLYSIVHDVTERKVAQEAVEKSARQYHGMLQSTMDGFWITDRDGMIVDVNNTLCKMLDYTREQLLTMSIADLVVEESDEDIRQHIEKIVTAGYDRFDTRYSRKGGAILDVEVSSTYIPKPNSYFCTFIRDITARKQADAENVKLNERLQQSQKMESIGTLAGGIAHDFNNILAAILGYAEMARDDCQPGSSIAKDLDEVVEAGNRAKSLVRQILAFSRQDDTERMILQPASIVKEAITMLRPSLPATIEIVQDIDAVTGLVFVDPSHLNQIVMNLCTNAFHAMEDTGGKLDISLKEVVLSNDDLVHEPDVTNGTFIQLSVGDSGTGISPSVRNKIFDPYFTTKSTGKGTGMGLSLAHGIVKNYGGFISVYSKLGEGTVFHVFLPTVEEEVVTENDINEQIPVGRERVLFVDDEEILTQMGKTMLERLGYHVTIRNNSLEALETFQNQPDTFDIVITDQTMPGMTGADLARRLMQIKPEIPIILCTGYSTIISEEKAKAMGIKEFAFKPLAKKDIATLIRKVLDVV